MNGQQFIKASNILVLRRNDGDGLSLINLGTGRVETIEGLQATQWKRWPVRESGTAQWRPPEPLLSGKFVIQRECHGEFNGPSLITCTCDSEVPRINHLNVTWYYESSDLVILYNSMAMTRTNPLLALGPYGTLCWRAIENGKPIRSIREQVESVFGRDEVLPFLKRLSDLGFLMPITGLHISQAVHETMVKEFPAPEVQWRMGQSAVPWYCLWELSKTCDLHCQICYLPDFADPGLDTRSALGVAKQIADSGTFYVCLLGGEVLLRRDLEQLIERLRAERIYVKVISNGVKLLAERAKALASAGLNQIEISFDGLSSQVHEKSRGPGTFSAAERALRTAQEAQIPRQGIVWTIHQDNIHELEKLPGFMHTHDVRECYISLFKKTGLMGARSSFQPLESREIETLRVALTNWKAQHPDLSIALLPGCSCGRTSVVIGSNGDVRPCSFSHLPVGNVLKRSLSHIWRELGQILPASGPSGFCAIKALSEN